MTSGQQDDGALIAALDSVREAAQRCFEHYNNQERLGVWLPHPSPNIDELTLPVRAAMDTHPKFKEQNNRFFGSKQLMLQSWHQSRNLLKITAEHDSPFAVAWLHKVYATERAKLRYVAEVYGLKVSEPVDLKNGVVLVPLEGLPPSPNARAVQSQFQVTPNRASWPPNIMTIPIGAIIETPELAYSSSYDEQLVNRIAPPRSDDLERTIRAFTLANGAAPVVGTSWLEFVDNELQMAEFGMMRMMALHEGRLPFSAVDVDADAIEWIERYLNLSPELRPVCDVAIERLNLARRRNSPGNRAIEGAISLEALLGPDGNQEITYRLRLRAALLLSTDFKERRVISNAVREFYTLRSNTVHGTPVKPKDMQANDGLLAVSSG